MIAGETGITIAEYIADIGLDMAREKVKNRVDYERLKKDLIEYVERQKKYNEICSIKEEIDFQGLFSHIRTNLIDEVSIRVFEPNRKSRGQARQNIIDKVVAYSHAKTPEAKKNVAKITMVCIDIIKKFYEKSYLTLKEYLIADGIVDAVAEDTQCIVNKEVDTLSKKMESRTDEIKDEIKDHIDKARDQTIAANRTLFSLDNALELKRTGNFSKIGEVLKTSFQCLSATHDYYPDFGYDYVGGRMQSIPLTEEARKKYPPGFIFEGAIKVGEKVYNNPNQDPLNDAYRQQLPIVMDIKRAKKILGELKDPLQDEAEDFEGKTVLFVPPEFPKAFPCAVKVGETTYFEYVLLRTCKIEEDGTYVINNREQGKNFFFELRFNLENPSNTGLKMNITHASNKDVLNYVRFISELSNKKDIHFYVLSLGEDIFAGRITGIDYESGFESVGEEIDFLERVCDIEEYFNVRLRLPREISVESYNDVMHMSNMIRNGMASGIWSKATYTGIIHPEFRETIRSLDREIKNLTYVGKASKKFFGVKLEFTFARTYNTAWIIDYEKICKKLEVLDDGDSIKIELRPGDDDGTMDTLDVPDDYINVSGGLGSLYSVF